MEMHTAERILLLYSIPESSTDHCQYFSPFVRQNCHLLLYQHPNHNLQLLRPCSISSPSSLSLSSARGPQPAARSASAKNRTAAIFVSSKLRGFTSSTARITVAIVPVPERHTGSSAKNLSSKVYKACGIPRLFHKNASRSCFASNPLVCRL